MKLSNENKLGALDNFIKYLQIPSVHPDVDYSGCVEFLKNYALDLGLPVVVQGKPNKPVVVITWEGTEPKLPSILLNSHMDVVPVYEEKWTHKPFAAEIDENGNIYARGSQDMKCVGIQYLEAIRSLRQANIRLKRTFHVSFVPDEESGGREGMHDWVKTKDFENLNIAMALDEGGPNIDDFFHVFYGERTLWHIIVNFPGSTGHGSLLLDDTAGEKLRNFLNRILEFRDFEKKRLADEKLEFGDVTGLNLTKLVGGVQANVVPASLSAVFDVRISPMLGIDKFEEMLKKWCEESGKDVYYESIKKDTEVKPSSIGKDNPWWVAFETTIKKIGCEIKPIICPASTDSRYLRGLNIPAYGFSPMNHTPVLVHGDDEFLNVDVFYRGIEIYYDLLQGLGSA